MPTFGPFRARGGGFRTRIKRDGFELVINSDQINAILSSGQVVGTMQSIAEGIASRARANAPVGSGEYREGIRVDVDRDSVVPVVHIAATAPHSRLIEAKTGNLKRAGG